jgi:protocatechuate 3,4-dioxygenase beta subunit
MDGQEDMSTPGMTLKVEIPDEQQVNQDLVIPDIVLTGTVLDASTGDRLAGVQVAAIEYEEDTPLRESVLASATRTDEEGGYVLEGLADNTYQLVFSKEGYGARTHDPIELDEDSTEEGLDMALEPVESVTVRVIDTRGNPVEGAFVSSQDYPPMIIAGTTGQTDMNGEVVLTGLVEGMCEFGVIASGYAPEVKSDVQVPTERGEAVRIEVGRGEPLTIHVVDSEDRPVSNATVRIREEDGPDLSSMILVTAMFEGRGMLTDSGGTLRIPNLEPGRYEVEVRWNELTTSEKVRIQAGKESRVELSF